jgi:glycine dehydrogenase subunit 2
MIEPTETESLEELDTFIEVMKEVVREAETDPALLHNSPHRFKVKRLDETQAARNPRLRG